MDCFKDLYDVRSSDCLAFLRDSLGIVFYLLSGFLWIASRSLLRGFLGVASYFHRGYIVFP